MDQNDDETPVIENEFQQRMLLLKYRLQCLMKLTKYSQNQNITSEVKEKHCPPIFDNLLCWNEVPANTLVRQHCPEYFKGFVTTEYAYKSCTENGTWYTLPNTTRPWTNFTLCRPPRGTFTTGTGKLDETLEVEKNLRLLYTTGYGLSLFCLVIAVVIMFFCRRLQSKSNVLHINLFIALIMRSIIALVRDTLFEMGGIGMASDFIKEPTGKLTFIEEGTHWECRLIVSLFHFAICACHMWIFIEGLYLYMLIHKPFYIGRKGVSFYIILGWTLPVLNIIPWVIVKATLENIYCWTVQENAYYFWILKGPGIVVIFINIFFFVDIIRMLCMRMRSRDQHNGQSYRYSKYFTSGLTAPLSSKFCKSNQSFVASQKSIPVKL